MNKLNIIIINAFKNPGTRNMAIRLAIGDALTIIGLMLAIVFKSIPAATLVIVVYTATFFITKHYMNILAGIPVYGEDTQDFDANIEDYEEDDRDEL